MSLQAKKWTEQGGRLDYDRVAIVPHFASLDEDDWFLPDIGIAPGAKIDSRTFSIAADVCQDGRGIWADRPTTAPLHSAVDVDELAEIERLERLVDQQNAQRSKLARRRANAEARRAQREKKAAEDVARELEFVEECGRKVALAHYLDTVRATLVSRQCDPSVDIMFIVDESEGYFDLAAGAYPTERRQLWRGITTEGKKVSVRGTGETFYGWPGEDK